jgi:chromosome segregation ATPase
MSNAQVEDLLRQLASLQAEHKKDDLEMNQVKGAIAAINKKLGQREQENRQTKSEFAHLLERVGKLCDRHADYGEKVEAMREKVMQMMEPHLVRHSRAAKPVKP